MNTQPEGITNPPIDGLLENIDSKYRLCCSPPSVHARSTRTTRSLARACSRTSAPWSPPLPRRSPSIALREMEQGLLKYTEIDPNEEVATTEVDPAFTFVDPFATGEETDTTQA